MGCVCLFSGLGRFLLSVAIYVFLLGFELVELATPSVVMFLVLTCLYGDFPITLYMFDCLDFIL